LVSTPPLIPHIDINPDGSFSGGAIIDGQLGVHPAEFSYHFSGHVHGVDAGGHARLAGLLNVTVHTTDSPSQHCTSNDQWWQATHS
jgi:hypothetical protein